MDIVLHEREMDVMEVLWERGNATAGEVLEVIPDDLAYNTILTILRRLEQKGYVGRTEEGRAHRYHPLIEREQARGSALQRLLDHVFGGSTELLLTHLVAKRQLNESEIRRLQELLGKHKPKGDS
jgi:BlaI family transcriptional regulator, penicillinase repressor